MDFRSDLNKNDDEFSELERDRRFFNHIQKLASIGFWERSLNSNANYWSSETYRIFGVEEGDYSNSLENFLNLVHPDNRGEVSAQTLNPRRGQFEMEFRIIRPDGEIRHIHQVVEFIYNEEGTPVHICGTIKDITEKKRFQEKIRLKEIEINRVQKKHEVLISQSHDIFCIVKENGEISYINEAFKITLGHDSKQCIGKVLLDYFDESDRRLLSKLIEGVKLKPEKRATADISISTKYGHLRYFEITLQNMLQESSVGGIVINLRDVTQRHKIEERMEFISTHDPKTGLPNSRYLNKKIRELCSQKDFIKGRFALLMISLRDVRDISDRVGSKVAVRLLNQIVERIHSVLGENDALARYSEGKLAIITQGFISEYEDLGKKVTALFSEPFNIDSYELTISTNVGITIYPKDLNAEHSIIDCAKIALLQARQEGENTYSFFSSDIDIYHYRKFMLRHDLRNAIKKNQLEIHYQPIVNLKTYEIIAAEASIVWSHPEWGDIEFEEFMWIANKTGLIGTIENWALKQVCENYKGWMEKGYPEIKVVFRALGTQFYKKSFLDNLIEMLNYYKLNPNFGIIEISEKLLFENSGKVNSILNSFREAGLSVAMESTGTMQCISQFDVDILKLDKSFLKKVDFEDKSRIMVETFIKLVRDLNLKLVLDGVEDWEQANLLSILKSVAVKGPLFSEAVCLSEFESMLAKKKCKPVLLKTYSMEKREERRKYYRIEFSQFLESEMSILRIRDKKVNVGTSTVLIRNIGPGGLCFISNIKFPVEKSIVLQFNTEIIGSDLKVYGNIVWTDEVKKGLFVYGLEFTIDEADRDRLVSVLNQVQIKMRNDLMFADGRFTSKSATHYFKTE